MTEFLQKLLKKLKQQISSDLTCLIKFDQNEFVLVDYVRSEGNLFDPSSVLKELDNNEFQSIQRILVAQYNFEDVITDNFILGNDQYYVFSASKSADNFSYKLKEKHLEITEDIKDFLLIMNHKSNISLAKSDYFHLFAEAANELIFTLDKSGSITSINKYGLDQLKYSNDELIGKHLFELISEEFKLNIASSFQSIISEKKQIEIVAELVPKVSKEIKFKIILIPIFNNGELEQLLGVGANISQRDGDKKKNEELVSKLKEANRINAIERDRAKQQIGILSELNSLKNEFISNVSHELRTPLASIIGFSETILDDNNLSVERAKEFSEVILTESKRLAKLINDILDFSELENEKKQLEKNSANIIEILNECKEGFKNECLEKNITLTSNIPESEIIIFADKNRIKKAFNYLLANAIKFTSSNGRVTLRAQEFLKEVEIVITDTGVGISEQKIPLLFDKFSKVKRVGNNLPGAGFGLVTVKQIIDLHKGLIRVKSEVDKGTSFIIRLPKYSFN